MGAPVVEPAVPETNRRGVVHARVVLPGLALSRGRPVRRIGRRPGVHHAREEDRAAVGTPQRARRAGRDTRDPLRLAAGEIQHVDLGHIIALAPGTERDSAAVAAPVDAALAALRVRETARRSAAVEGHEPEIADLLAFRVGWIGYAEHNPAPVRADRGRTDPLREVDVLVGDRVACTGLLRRDWCRESNEDHRESVHTSLLER